MDTAKRLNSFYRRLCRRFGAQHWWPAKGPFEVMVGAILTQNTSWANAKKAVDNLRKAGVLHPAKMGSLALTRLASLIRPCGYYNIKAHRLKEFLRFFNAEFKGKIGNFSCVGTAKLRLQLLAVKGIGPETADSILLYALNRPVFVIDAYTKRFLSRHKIVKEGVPYQQAQDLFMHSLKKDVKLFNEYHALIVKLAKEYCLKSKPKCPLCPLKAK
jgi:endonuclease-3 related protein